MPIPGYDVSLNITSVVHEYQDHINNYKVIVEGITVKTIDIKMEEKSPNE